MAYTLVEKMRPHQQKFNTKMLKCSCQLGHIDVDIVEPKNDDSDVLVDTFLLVINKNVFI